MISGLPISTFFSEVLWSHGEIKENMTVNFWFSTPESLSMKWNWWLAQISPRVMSRGHGMIFPYGQRCWWHNLSTFSGFWFKTARVFTMKLDISRVNPGIYKLEPKNHPFLKSGKSSGSPSTFQPLGSSRWVSRVGARGWSGIPWRLGLFLKTIGWPWLGIYWVIYLIYRI